MYAYAYVFSDALCRRRAKASNRHTRTISMDDGSFEPLAEHGAAHPLDARFPRDAGRISRPYLARIAVKSVNRIVIVQVARIVRLQGEDNSVRLGGGGPDLHKE